MVESFEKIPVQIFPTPLEGSIFAARQIAALIKEKQTAGEQCVLGLATGSSPISLYRELVRLHREEGLSFANVTSFNLDEYYPLERKAVQSYWHFMHQYLFDHIDIKAENIHIPNGEWKKRK
jgi:glucosamine-6-phosphate deaminase